MNTQTNIFSNNSNSEAQTRYLLSRIENYEKHLSEAQTVLNSYSRKLARIRDEGDSFALNLLQFAESEKINTSLRSGLTNFANCLSAIQDFRNEEIQKIEEKVANEISLCGESTRRAKEEFRTNSNARNKQLVDNRDGKLKEMGRSTSFNEVSNIFRIYELQIQRFEMKKLCDLKKIFLDFTKSELIFHVKTVEILTKAYKEILSIDEESDLQEFCAFFNFTQISSPKNENVSKSTDIDRTGMSSTLRRFNSTPNFDTFANKSDSLVMEKSKDYNDYESESDIEESNYSTKETKTER